jgi:hypothetical protein
VLEVHLGQIWGNCPLEHDRPYEVFFLRSAQRFFIGNDKRLLPSGVRPPRFFAFNTGGRGIATLVFLAIRGEFVPPENQVLSPHAAAQVLFRKVFVLRAGCPNSR